MREFSTRHHDASAHDRDCAPHLVPAEANCAFIEVGGARLGSECARIKEAVNAVPEKRKAWADVVPTWSYLDQILLALRATEDRLGIDCGLR